ncbi:MAG: hypothetical protein U5K71_12100 [Gracilimonas sp.]|nr:hypothetical protein [Gracilimonas sp.]
MKLCRFVFGNNLNIYPTDTGEIENNIQSGDYNLELPSLTDSQGFFAWIIFTVWVEDDAEIITYYSSNTNAVSYS